jgi:hypothetical protein
MADKGDLETWRQKTIDLLTTCYSEDRLSLEQFESRVERAGIAQSTDELSSLLADMPPAYHVTPTGSGATGEGRQVHGRRGNRAADPGRGEPAANGAIVTSEPRNVTSILSERKLHIESTHSNAVSVLGDMRITVPDFSDSADTVYVQVAAVLSEVTIVVPNGIVVDNRITPMLSEMKDTASRATRSGPVLRLEGFSLMSEVKIRSGLPQ